MTMKRERTGKNGKAENTWKGRERTPYVVGGFPFPFFPVSKAFPFGIGEAA
jgi:hypothetical protein